MQNYKKLALAIALAIPAAAQADVTIYGFLSGGLESAKATGAAPAAEYKSTTRVVDNNSRIGFKGNEDLGGGLKAIWQVESSLRNFEQGGTNDKGQTAVFGTRNTFIGLQGNSWGTVLLGQYDSAYKRLTSNGLNVLADTTADTQASTSIFSRREARLANSVHYTTPVFAGLQAGVSYGADENAATKADRWDLAANYTNGGLQLGLGYDYQGSQISATVDKIQGYKATASYKLASTGTFIGAGYERVKVDNITAADTTQDDWLISAAQPIGAFTLKAGYGQLGKLKNAATGNPDDYKAKQWLVGATYDLSKRTQAYVYGTKIRNNKSQNVNFNVNPIYSTGAGTSAAALTAGNDPQAFGIGLKHSF
jgi:predicted porin